METEKRYITSEMRLLSNEDGSRYVEGYALKFNELSQNLGGFYEQILPEAIDNEIINNSDIYCYINHNEYNGVLARSRFGNGSLQLTVDEVGLKYRFKIGKSSQHQQLVEYIERGEIFASSFAFTVNSDDWTKLDDGNYLRRIKKFERIYDVSPVFEPAYPATEVALRKLNELTENEKNVLMIKKELENYYNELKNKYKYD